MGLIGQSAGERDLAERLGRGLHHLLGALDTQTDEIGVRCLAEAPLEGPAETTRAQRNHPGQSLDTDGVSQILREIGFDAALLPGRESAARIDRQRRQDFLPVVGSRTKPRHRRPRLGPESLMVRHGLAPSLALNQWRNSTERTGKLYPTKV